MAIIRFNNGKEESVSPETGASVWLVLCGEVDPTKEQENFMLRVKNVHLNWRNAPDSYIQKRFDMILQFALADWSVNRAGKPVRPQGEFAWAFAKRWGLWENGRPSSLVVGGNTRLL